MSKPNVFWLWWHLGPDTVGQWNTLARSIERKKEGQWLNMQLQRGKTSTTKKCEHGNSTIITFPKRIVPHHQPLTTCAFILHHPTILLLGMNTITTNASLEAASQTIEMVLQTDVVTGGDRWSNALHRISEVMVSIANILLQYYSTHIFQTHMHSVKDASLTWTYSFLPAFWTGDTHEETDFLPIGN